MKKCLRTKNLLLALGLLVFISAIPAAEEAPVKFQSKPLLGEELTYRVELTGKATMPGGVVQATKGEGKTTSICVQVDDEGVKTVVEMLSFGLPEYKWENVSPEQLKMFEESQKTEEFKQILAAASSLSITRSRPDGAVLSKTIPPMAPLMGGQGMAGLKAEPQAPIFPDKPVNIGESWERKMNGVSFKWTLLGVEEVQGYRCAKIQFEVTDKSPTTAEATAFFAIEEGFPVKMVTNFKSTTTGRAGEFSSAGSMTTELTERHKLSPDELKKVQEEVAELEIGFAYLEKQEQDAAKAAFQQFLSAHPESRFREGVEGLIAQIDIMEKMAKEKKAQAEKSE